MNRLKILIVSLLFVSACGPKTIFQTDTNTPIDLSGRWNNTDAEIATNQIFNDLLKSDWLKQHSANKNYTLSILVDDFSNDMANELYNVEIVNYFKKYVENSRQFNLIEEDDTSVPYLILKGKLSSENFELNKQTGINYHMEVQLFNTEGTVLWAEDDYIKKFLKE
jgi:hypothetical protein